MIDKTPYIKSCLICKKQFTKPKNCGLPEWNENRKYCSKECCLNGTFKKEGRISWNKGKIGINAGIPHTKEWNEKISSAQKNKPRPKTTGENHPNWKGGISRKKTNKTLIRGKFPIPCITCGNIFFVYAYQLKNNLKFCSHKCVRHTEEVKDKMKSSGRRAWNKGLTKNTDSRLAEYGAKCSITKKGAIPYNKGKKSDKPAWNKGKKIDKISNEKHWNWKGGKTAEGAKIRNSIEYKAWRISVFKRDWFKCVECGYRSKTNKDIVADHIKPFCFFPDLRLDINNGRTLCKKCDKEIAFKYERDKHKYISDKIRA